MFCRIAAKLYIINCILTGKTLDCNNVCFSQFNQMVCTVGDLDYLAEYVILPPSLNIYVKLRFWFTDWYILCMYKIACKLFRFELTYHHSLYSLDSVLMAYWHCIITKFGFFCTFTVNEVIKYYERMEKIRNKAQPKSTSQVNLLTVDQTKDVFKQWQNLNLIYSGWQWLWPLLLISGLQVEPGEMSKWRRHLKVTTKLL